MCLHRTSASANILKVSNGGISTFASVGSEISATGGYVANGRNIVVDDMAKFMGTKGFSMDKGYGKIKGKTFRIAHMGDMQASTLEEVLSGLDEFLGVD